MSDEAHARLPRSSVEFAYEWFCRAVAVKCIAFGLFYWIRLIGLYEGDLWRFDLMPLHWQVAGAMLSVLFPIAAIGLWMAVSWGPVLWVIAAAAEIVMHGALPDLFGYRPGLVALHVATLIGLVGFRVMLYLQHLQRVERY
ncbi:MAG: hypothetical protein JJ913_15650 [Rhizobiaceae bacterium]|nr:hypothetical protein [Rhizobiaceae bacterium]